MPAEVIAAGLGAIGIGGGAALSARAQNRATDASDRANQEAMAFQREQGGKGEEAYRARWDAWNAGRNALLEKYGIDIAPPTMSGPGGEVPGGPGAVPRPGGGAPGGGGAPRPGIGPLGAPGTPSAGSPAGAAGGPGAPQGQSLGELADFGRGPRELGSWNDWRSMGLRG